jgi:glycosyltransferase involved in cell wall biosynthesis
MPGEQPLVSIVTPSFNQGKYIERTILSVLRQDYANIEYIVLDSLSDDETTAVLERYKHRISRVIREKDRGQSDALHRGFAMCSGSILAYLNADDCLANAGIVSHAVEQLARTAADVVYGRRYRIDADGYFLDSYPYRPFDGALIQQFNLVPQECTFWTREIYERAGAYVDKDLHFVMDYDMWLRFLKLGARFESVDKVYAYFRWHANQKSQVIWRDVCLPEVDKIQRQNCGNATACGEMELLHESFYYGADALRFPHAHAAAATLWKQQATYARQVFADTPLDSWVYAGAIGAADGIIG